MESMGWFGLLFLLCVTSGSLAQDSTFKLVVLIEDGQQHFNEWFQTSLNTISADVLGTNFETVFVTVEHEDDDYSKICDGFAQGGTILFDLTWSGNDKALDTAERMNVPYLRVDLSIAPFLRLLDLYLIARSSSDVVVIFDNPDYLDQALYYWFDTTILRMVISEKLDSTSAARLRGLRPTPNSYAIVASTDNLTKTFELATREDLVALPERWNLVFLDFSYERVLQNKIFIPPSINLLTPDISACCKLQGQLQGRVPCKCPENFNIQQNFLTTVLRLLSKIVKGTKGLPERISCSGSGYEENVKNNFDGVFETFLKGSDIIYNDNGVLRAKLNASIRVVSAESDYEVVGRYDENEQISVEKDKEVKPVKAFYRVGTTYALPYAYQVENLETKELEWTGYCMDYLQKLSELMNFEYEVVVPENGTFGEKDSEGRWDGVIGDLVSGQTDMAFTAMVMTADREEVVDFVAPYFEQSGISIVMRKPVRKTSLFKFMTVLKLEVWLSIVAALIVTAVMIWLLDMYSPYSSRNNKKAYPYPCRDFTLKESFWFALTSFTPQGGGEAPKALSGRTLVAAYWLFVVLMLATFTANLAAFLTVERMQTPVQSLEQLTRQSRINYTVVEGSDTHKYFINMKYAEDTLYRVWKELTLNASTDETRYRVWDYPIKEQYSRILLAINEARPVADAEEGFRIVNERLDADFAFIHDSSEVKYEVSRNCNLTEVGEVFGERPYAVTVQQGSHLQDEISVMVLELSKDRYFEYLKEKYWNKSARGKCEDLDESEGITLESLGGVFIATLFGLALAMLTLAAEVLYYKRKLNKARGDKQPNKIGAGKKFAGAQKVKPAPELVTIGKKFKPIQLDKSPEMNISSIYPKSRLPYIN